MTNIKIDYDHVWHHHPLKVQFFINDLEIEQEVDVDLPDGEHEYKIVVSGKTFDNVLQEAGKTVKDSYINIKHLVVDNIDLQKIMMLNAKFYPDHPDPKAPILDRLTELGYNGQYKFKFKTPLYLWVLEKINE